MKKKWLIGIVAGLMGATLAVGLAACGPKNPDGMSDADIAKAAINNVKIQYADADKNTPADYTVVHSVSVSGTAYTVEWSIEGITEGVTIADFVAVGETDAENNTVTIDVKQTSQVVDYKLNAKVTVGKAEGTASFERTIPLVYTVAGAKELGKSLEKGAYYTVDNEVTMVTVRAYIIETGTWSDGYKNYTGTYVSDKADGTKEGEESMQVYRIDQDDKFVTGDGSLGRGDIIMVKGYLQNYNGALQISYYKSGSTTTNPSAVSYELGTITNEQRLANAKEALSIATTYTKAATATLPSVIEHNVKIEWTVKSGAEYASIADGTLTIKNVPTEGEQKDVVLTAKLTAGDKSEEIDFTLKVGKLPDAGTADNPYTVERALIELKQLESGQYSDKVYVRGYVIDKGTWQEANTRWQGVYIGDKADATKEECAYIYRLQSDNTWLPNDDALVVGDIITVSGYLNNYNGTYEINYKGSENVVCVKVEKPNLSDDEKAQQALDGIVLPTEIKTELDLPGAGIAGVTVKYTSSNTAALEVSQDGTKLIPHRGSADVTVTITIETDSNGVKKTGTREIKVLKEAEIEDGDYTYTFNFSNLPKDEQDTGVTSTDKMLEYLNGLTEKDLIAEVTTVTNVYTGQGSDGRHPNSVELLKMGKSKTDGQLVLIFEKPISKIVVSAEGWTDTDKLTINGVEHTISTAQASYTYEFDPIEEVTITSDDRVLLFSMTVTVGGAAKTPAQKVAAAKEAITANDGSAVYKENYDLIGSFDLPSSLSGATLTWTLASYEGTQGDVTVAKNKIVINKLPDADKKLNLSVAISSGEGEGVVTETLAVTDKITVKALGITLTNDGSESKPYTVEEVRTIAAKLKSGAYWGGTTATKVYVKGYVLDIGTYNADSKKQQFENVYIVDASLKDAENNDNNKKSAIIVYGLKFGGDLKLAGDMSKGSEITVYGYIENYSGKFEVTTWYDGSASQPVETKSYTDARTAVQKQEAAIAAAKAAIGTTVSADVTEVTLPASTITGVTLSYAKKEGGALEGKLTVEHTDSETQVTITITAKYGSDADKTEDVTLTVEEEENCLVNIKPDSLTGLGSTYADGTGVTVDGVTFSWFQFYKKDSGIQWRAGSSGKKDSSIWNTTAFSQAVTKIVLVFNSGKESASTMQVKVEWSTSADFAAESTKTQTVSWTDKSARLTIEPEEAGEYTFIRLSYGGGTKTQYYDNIKFF